MIIKKITVGGFKNIKYNSISFSEITSLISLNNYGKSNILLAIDFGLSFIKTTDSARSDMMRYIEGIPINKEIFYNDFYYEIEGNIVISDKTYSVVYGYTFSWEKNYKNPESKINKEWLKIKSNKSYNEVIKKDGVNGFYKSTESGRCNKPIISLDNELLINKIKSFDEVYYVDIIKELISTEFYLCRHLDTVENYKPQPFRTLTINSLDFSDIAKTLYILKKEKKNKYLLLIDSFKILFPKIKEINVLKYSISKNSVPKKFKDSPIVLKNNIYRITYLDDNLYEEIDFEFASDGTRRIFLMLLIAIIADDNHVSLIAFKEPENSIHPSLLKNYLSILSQLLENCKVIITSHSPYIVKYLDIDSMYIGLPSDNGIPSFLKIKKTKVKQLLNIATKYNLSTGDYIFDMLSDDSSDFDELKEYIQ